jgi:hypothetical protein
MNIDDFDTQIQCEEVYTEDLYGITRFSDEENSEENI